MKLAGFATGVLALAALEVVTSSPGAANRTAALPVAAAALARRLLDPNIALLPNWHDSTAPLHSNTAAASAGAAAPAFDVPSAGPGSPGRAPIVAPPPGFDVPSAGPGSPGHTSTSSAHALRQTHMGGL